MSPDWLTSSLFYGDGVELVAVQDEGFACALCLNSEEGREQVGRVEVRGGRPSGFREKLFFFGLLIVIGDRGKVRKLKLVVEGKVRSRVGRVDPARVRQVVRHALALEAHPPAGADLFRCAGGRPLAAVLSHGARRKFAAAPVPEKCE